MPKRTARILSELVKSGEEPSSLLDRFRKAKKKRASRSGDKRGKAKRREAVKKFLEAMKKRREKRKK